MFWVPYVPYSNHPGAHAPLCSLQEKQGEQDSNALHLHAQRLGVATAGAQVAVHPLEGVLENLTYQDWQLETPEPLLPQVNSVNLIFTRRVINGCRAC